MRPLPIIPLAVLAFLAGCAATATESITVKNPQPAPPPVITDAGPTAGAATADLTPPPGMPMGGYSLMANRGVGFRTRIKARIIYLNDSNGQSVALVQTDLPAGSLLLHHRVAERVSHLTGLSPGDIAITASHSHSGPANIFNNNFYNKHMSSGQWLESNFLDFAVARISNGILRAYSNRRPARIATGTRAIHGYNRNRSLEAHVRNPGKGHIDVDDPEAKFEAVNPTLYMLRVDARNEDGDYQPLGAFSSFSVHATALSPLVQVYNADLFAYAQKELEWRIEEQYQTPWPVVHALSTGTQGDMAPAVEDRGDMYIRHFDVNWKAARRLGMGIGREAIKLFETLEPRLNKDMRLNTAAREINIRKHNQVGNATICKDAAVGNPLAAGAYERRTPWLTLIPFLHGGNVMARRWLFTESCQGAKRHLGFSFFQPLLEPKDSFPETVMFQLVRINNAAILPLPFEITLEAGERISDRVGEAFSGMEQPPEHLWITSNANGYFGYAATPEEYANQNYEGGHTLYGKHTVPYLAGRLAELVTDSIREPRIHQLHPEWRYQLRTNQFLPDARTSNGKREWLAGPQMVQASEEHKEDFIRVRWRDTGPDNIDFHRRLARVEHRVDGQWQQLRVDGRPIHDGGYDISIRHRHNSDQSMAEYEARWYNPVTDGPFRFVIEPRDGRSRLESEPFHTRLH